METKEEEIEKMMIRAKDILIGDAPDDVVRAHVMIEWCRELRLAKGGKAPKEATTNNKRKRAPFTEGDPPSSLDAGADDL